jgi:sterol 14-demethylase
MSTLKLSTGKGQSNALATIVPAGATVVATALLLRRWLRSRQEPPGFTVGMPLVGPISQFLKDPMELMRMGYSKLGECFKVNFIGMDMVFLVGPDGHEWFFTKDKYFDFQNMYKFTVPIFGPKVLYDVDHSTRACQLRFIRERLTDSCLESYTGTLEEEVVQFFDECWPGLEGVVDIRDSMQELLTRTSVRCLMGNELRQSMIDKKPGDKSIVELLHILEKGMLPLSVFWPHAPIQRHRERDDARRTIHEMIVPILAERRKKADKTETDFLQSLLNGTYPDKTKISDEEIVGFLVAAFFGGMHNSSITTSWSTLEIFARPDLVKEMIEEQRTVLGPKADAKFTFQGYKNMKKMRSAVTEVLRMHPPLFLLMRTMEEDVKFKDKIIRRGNVVVCSPNVGGMLDNVYKDAKSFDPNRFKDGIDNEWAYIPFGGGKRICKGQEFGFMQVQCAISYMLRNFDIECLDGVPEPTIAHDGLVIAPSQPCRVQYRRKRA